MSIIWDGETLYNFEWPNGFIDLIRVEGRDKVIFDGWVTITPPSGVEIPAYEFGVQSLWELIVEAHAKDYFANCEVSNPGQYGNSVTIHLYRVNEDGTVEQVTESPPYAVPLRISFFGEGN